MRKSPGPSSIACSTRCAIPTDPYKVELRRDGFAKFVGLNSGSRGRHRRGHATARQKPRRRKGGGWTQKPHDQIERKPVLRRAVVRHGPRQHRRCRHRHGPPGAGPLPEPGRRGPHRLARRRGPRQGAGRGLPHRQRADPEAGREPGREGPRHRPDRRPRQPHRAHRPRPGGNARSTTVRPPSRTSRAGSPASSSSSATSPRSGGRTC